MRNVDQVALIDHSAEDHRIFIIVVGWLLFVLWESYWVLEIREQYVTRGRLELLYVFLPFMLVGNPFALYLFLRRQSSGQGRYRCPAFRQSPGGG